jgi:DNA (cytosine-5)-methyltransferase 1
MRFGSVCSGIEAASVAWKPLGWEPQWFSEIEKFPNDVLSARHTGVPNLGDMTKIHESEIFNGRSIDLLVGGTPCQSFSIAGLRKGLRDPRGNLTLVFLGVIERTRPRWVVWENVPGVLSDDRGRTFGTFLGGLAKLGYGFAYRVLDAQHFGVPQRRRRVFVVGHSGGAWQRAAAVLFERHSLSWNSPPRREAGTQVTGTLTSRTSSGGGFGTDFECDGGLVAATLLGKGNLSHDSSQDTLIAHTLRGEGFDASEDGSGRGTPLIAIPFDTTQITSAQNRSNPKPGDPSHPLTAHGHAPAIALTCKDYGADVSDISPTLRAMNHSGSHANDGGQVAIASPKFGVRRLTPRECERLQGFPDDYTLIERNGKPAADGPRYKAIGNSMAVPVMAWIGRRIQMIETEVVA